MRGKHRQTHEWNWTDWYPIALFVGLIVGCVVIGLRNGWS